MTFSLTVDAKTFRAHQSDLVKTYAKAGADLVPVIKGNGYGFSRGVLANEAQLIGAKRIAIGNVWELDQALADFAGEIVVLEPFNENDELAQSTWKRILQHNSDRVIATLSSTDLAAASAAGIRNALLEVETSVHRFGMPVTELIHAADAARKNISVKGITLHLPIADPVQSKVLDLETPANHNSRKLGKRLLEVATWLTSYNQIATEYDLPKHISLSHVSAKDIELLRNYVTSIDLQFTFDVRVGTQLWLGAPKALKATGTILEIHELTQQTHVGYQQVDGRNHKRLLVVSGGTAHGVALAAPTSRASLRKKGIAIAEGFSQARGKVRSPFSRKNENFIFAEAPHMHVSLLWTDDMNLTVGETLDCNVRNTTTNFDVVLGLN
jgi:alanine racemase